MPRLYSYVRCTVLYAICMCSYGHILFINHFQKVHMQMQILPFPYQFLYDQQLFYISAVFGWFLFEYPPREFPFVCTYVSRQGEHSLWMHNVWICGNSYMPCTNVTCVFHLYSESCFVLLCVLRKQKAKRVDAQGLIQLFISLEHHYSDLHWYYYCHCYMHLCTCFY